MFSPISPGSYLAVTTGRMLLSGAEFPDDRTVKGSRKIVLSRVKGSSYRSAEEAVKGP